MLDTICGLYFGACLQVIGFEKYGSLTNSLKATMGLPVDPVPAATAATATAEAATAAAQASTSAPDRVQVRHRNHREDVTEIAQSYRHATTTEYEPWRYPCTFRLD